MNRQTEIAIKTERLREMLGAKKLGGVLINSQANFAWLTAGATNQIDRNRENGAATLFVRRDGRKFILASRIEMPRMLAEEVSAEEFEPVEYEWTQEKAAGDFLTNKALSLLDASGTIGADLYFNPDTPVVEADIASCRYELTAPEIERFQKLGAEAGAIIGGVIRALKGGETETEIARRVNHSLAARNICAVVNLIAADERLKNFRHPLPTDKVWRETLMIVVCARRVGLTASLSRIVCAGNIPEDLRKRTNACARVNARMLAATRIGATGAEIFQTAADAYAAENFAGEEMRHHQGGAAGYKTRDWTAHPKSTETVKNDQAFAWNPSITGTKCEETVIVRGDAIETLTTTPDFPQISVEIEQREYVSPGIYSL